MCGIVGLHHRVSRRPVDPALVERMCDSIAHRGPDDQGVFIDGAVGLGHRRLSILDLAGAHQPMASPDGECVIVYNGEVYNFAELREELAERGRRVKSTGDTEVVLALYEEFGLDFVNKLVGMFALAIWDARNQRLVLARDRFGIKPLFLHEDADGLAFASEIKALLERPGIDRSWDEQGLHDYFSLLYVPGPRTAYAKIRQLEPGHMLVSDADGVQTHRYYTLAPTETRPVAEAIERFESLLIDAVGLRTVADVPVGAFLSGGIDSGLVVAFMSQALEEPVRSFTVFDPDAPYYDERELAGQVAARYHTRHTELSARSDALAMLDEIGPTFDQPFADSGAFPNLAVCRAGRQEVTVALSGLGGDELSAGYVRHLGMQLGQKLRWAPRALGAVARTLADALPEGEGLGFDRVKRFARLVGLSESEAYASMLSAGGRLERPVLSQAFRRRVDEESVVRHIGARLGEADALGLDSVNRVLYTDLQTYIPDDLLVLADRTSMRVGLEVRVPFLDHRVVEQALAIPGSEKIRGRTLKAMLKGVARPYLPASVIDGKKKGFSIPMDDWLRGPLCSEMTRAIEEVAPDTGYFDGDGLRRAWEAHRARRANHEEILWATLAFARWAERA